MTTLSPPINLDHNATTPPLPEVVEVVSRVMTDVTGNPGSRHRFGRQARRVLEEARESIASILEADPSEVVFTSGGTESNNLAIHGLARGRPATLALSPGEHPSCAEACRALGLRGWKLHHCPVDSSGRLLPNELPSDTRLVAMIYAHNETGVIQDVTSLARMCLSRGIPLHLDAVQAVGKIPVSFRSLGATTLSFAAHKFHGPRGIGGLLIRANTPMTPLLHGGHQEADRRAGTEPVALIAGMAKALEMWNAARLERTRHVTALRDQLQSALEQRCAPTAVNGRDASRLPNTLNISFPGLDGEALLIALDLEGICCSLGSTCASGSAEPAPILVAMGLNSDTYRSAVRFSLSFQNTAGEIDDAVSRIARVVERLRKSNG